MGGDGGVIAAKREFMQSCGDVFGMKGGMVKTALNRTETAELRMKVCAISNERLREPVVACELGYLYNKDTLISGLLERNLNEAFSHIRGLKDVVDCRFTPNPSSGAKERALDGPEPSQYMCPVTLQEMNGSHSFVVLKTSGWVLSEKAIKEVGIDSLQGEYGPFSESDVIHLAPTDEERKGRRKELMKRRDLARQAKKDAKKMSKKKARREEPSGAEAGTATNEAKGAHNEDGDEVEAAKGSRDHKSGKRRRRSEKEACRGGDTGSSRGRTGAAAPESSSVASAAAQAVEDAKQSSAVYASLFGKKKVSNEHLFIATAGHRYNLG